MLELAIGGGVVLLCCVVFRFIQPGLVYRFRDLVVAVRINRLFLEKQEGLAVGRKLPPLMAMMLEYQGVQCGVGDVRSRVDQIRELYSLLQGDRPGIDEANRTRHKSRCLRQLADVLSEISPHAKSLGDHGVGTISADRILASIAFPKDQEKMLHAKGKEIEEVLTKSQMSLSQASELVIAAIFGVLWASESLTDR